MNLSGLRSTHLVLIASAALLLSAGGGAFAGAQITGANIVDSTVTTKDIKNNSLKAIDLSPGARAFLRGAQGEPGPAQHYGHVAADLTVTRQSGGITTTSLGPGSYCVIVPGLDAQNSSAVATIDFNSSATGGSVSSFIEVNFVNGNCPADGFGVVTYTRDFSVPNAPLTYFSLPFFIMISP